MTDLADLPQSTEENPTVVFVSGHGQGIYLYSVGTERTRRYRVLLEMGYYIWCRREEILLAET